MGETPKHLEGATIVAPGDRLRALAGKEPRSDEHFAIRAAAPKYNLIYGGEIRGTHYRILQCGKHWMLERREVDGLGDPRWVTEVNSSAAPIPSMYVTVLVELLADLAEKGRALVKTFDYSTGEGT
jgi:hypothetical protein